MRNKFLFNDETETAVLNRQRSSLCGFET